MLIDAAQHVRARLWLRKCIVTPCCGKLARQMRMVRMGHQPPSIMSLKS